MPNAPRAPRQRAMVLHPFLKRKESGSRSRQAQLEEAAGLCEAIDLDIVDARLVPQAQFRPATLLGTGKLEELAAFAKENDVALVVMDSPLTPIQQRNLEKSLSAKVIDRTALILEIFGARARTKEGRLQVELASLTYQKSRLVRSWTHLERQRGGFGFLGGPGESQLEIDRRLIAERIAQVKQQLEKVRRTRGLHRQHRADVPYIVAALVGYTNAGKSTLFNRLTGAGVVAEDMLFATLDPTLRRITLPSGRVILLSDTVGFISNLPHELVAAFRATLEEVQEADIVLHVRDIAHPDSVAQRQDVLAVLKELQVEETPQLEVWNKVDLLPDGQLPAGEQGEGVGVSALTGQGCDTLLQKLDNLISAHAHRYHLSLPVADGKALALLHAQGKVLETRYEDDRVEVDVELSDIAAARVQAQLGITLDIMSLYS